MPSLRRVNSSPSIRAVPYAVQLSSGTGSSSGTGGARRTLTQRRRPSVLGLRTVLGEMPWWQVQRGQQPDHEDALEPNSNVLFADEDEDDALIAEAVRIAISHRDHDRAAPEQLDLTDEQASEATGTNFVEAPTLNSARFFPDDELASPPSSPPALSEPLSPSSSRTSSPMSSLPSSPTTLRPHDRLAQGVPLCSPTRHTITNTQLSQRPLSLFRSLPFDDVASDELIVTDISLDEIIADLTAPANISGPSGKLLQNHSRMSQAAHA
ncbi:hypothetical protein BKA62DRAFT_768337 [Auriculariales sp. MPI-PUGE-AT-0066]|nr:hypothetical protein BKA62DRAFT_768337 [Auriculariales sp. MPI-PUGE-AT-0066]